MEDPGEKAARIKAQKSLTVMAGILQKARKMKTADLELVNQWLVLTAQLMDNEKIVTQVTVPPGGRPDPGGETYGIFDLRIVGGLQASSK